MIELLFIMSIGVPIEDGTYDTAWQLEVFPEGKLDDYHKYCNSGTGGCTLMEQKKIWVYEPHMNGVPWYGGTTILWHELLHARGLDHNQIKQQYPNPSVNDYWNNYIPAEKSPKLIESIRLLKEKQFR